MKYRNIKKPPISWYGGKQRMSNNIIPLIPPHMVYCEPFAGGCAVLFKKPYPNITNNEHYREVINDIDSDLINFFTVLRDNGEELCEKLKLTLYSEEERRRAKKYEGSDLERARRFYVRVMTGFGNVPHGGWKRSVRDQNHTETYFDKVNQLPQYIERMRHVAIACDDAIKVIGQFDSPQTFFYIDPPYINTDMSDYKGYTEKDYLNLIERLESVEGSFILSNYPQPNIKYPDNWVEYKFNAFTTVAGKNHNVAKKGTRRTEVLYYKPRTGILQERERKVFESGVLDCFTGK